MGGGKGGWGGREGGEVGDHSPAQRRPWSIPSTHAAGLGRAPAVGGEIGGGVRAHQATDFRTAFGRPIFGRLLKIFKADPGFLSAGSLGAPHGASPTPVREAGNALVARALSPTVPELTHFTSASQPGPSFAPIPAYSNRVARLPVQLRLLGERPRLVRSHSVHHTPSPAVAAGATHAAVRPPSKQLNSPEKL